jgi:DUF1365 family protein
MALSSCLYECVVTHRRLRPKPYGFSHRIMMLYADLDELESIDRGSRLLSYNRRNLFCFRDSDYFPTAAPGPLKARVCAFLQEHGVDLPPGCRIRLLTLPRILGYIFNPISIYFCFDHAQSPLCAIAEVGNTFRESKLFLLTGSALRSQPAGFHLRVPKHYYVSPFSSLDICFGFDLRLPSERLLIHIDDWAGDERVLESLLRGVRVPLSDAQLLRFACIYPALTLKVMALIHWHALRLAIKRVPWHRKADRPELQREVLNPRL